MTEMLTLIRQAAQKRLEFGPHADKRMEQQEPALTKAELQVAIQNGQIIEDYPEDLRGHSCLLCGYGLETQACPERDGGRVPRPVHIVCSPKAEYLFVITAYVPDSARWDSEFKRRIV